MKLTQETVGGSRTLDYEPGKEGFVEFEDTANGTYVYLELGDLPQKLREFWDRYHEAHENILDALAQCDPDNPEVVADQVMVQAQNMVDDVVKLLPTKAIN